MQLRFRRRGIKALPVGVYISAINNELAFQVLTVADTRRQMPNCKSGFNGIKGGLSGGYYRQ